MNANKLGSGLSNKQKTAVGLVVFGILAVSVWKIDKDYGTFSGAFGGSGEDFLEQRCYPLSFDITDNGTYAIPEGLTCVNGVWVDENELVGTDKTYCDGYYTLVTVNYTTSGVITKKQQAQGNEFCQDGVMSLSPLTCGDYFCGQNETEGNCVIDCGIIQSWSRMKEISSDPALQGYLTATGVFSTTPEVELLAKEIEAQNPNTPFEAVKLLTRAIVKKVSYVSSGVQGNVLCGENSEIILERGFGNCVDYSTVEIAVLRRGFDIPNIGRVKIPTRQVAGCVFGQGDWHATEFQVASFVDNILAGQAAGHSWTEIYLGNGRWDMADPTADVSIAKNWVGYHRIENNIGNNQLCNIPIGAVPFCQVFSETGVEE